MMRRRPLTCLRGDWYSQPMTELPASVTIGLTFGALSSAKPYRAPLEKQGAQCIELRPDKTLPDLHTLDGLLLSGGGDVEARHFGQQQHPKAQTPDHARDEMELTITRKALQLGLPILGICRGVQVLGVALGGQLFQDLDSELPGVAKHSTQSGNKELRHWVTVLPGSRLAAILGASQVRVNTFHHQANSVLGPQTVRTAWSDDGVTEAIALDSDKFVLGVQWHPERMWRSAPRQRKLFKAFVEACRTYHQTHKR
jgi:putative glutamine amidotransferase